MHNFRHLHLSFLFLRPSIPNPNEFHIPVLSTYLLFALSKPGHPHQKYIATFVFATDNSVRQYTFGGGGGNRTLVQNTFLSASYSNSVL